jgi:2-C-methyl-D-erythritol 4-phosphate cytidylyltransferase
METLAILVAAGRGERMGASRPKAFVSLGGQTLLERSARALAACSEVTGLVAVVPPELKDEARDLCAGLVTPCQVVAGGLRRQDSVRAGLDALPPTFEGVVLVHDAARPFVPVEVVEAVVRGAQEYGAAIPIVPMPDTVKEIAGGRVVSTVDRERLGGAQTPQGFRLEVLARAYASAFADGVVVTDESMAVERLGLPVACVAGSPRNRKLTTPEDLQWAEQALAADVRP